jgi:hypothetical protein
MTAALAALAACGGGGNESGDPEMLFVSPAGVVVTGPAGACAVGSGPVIHVYGGQPPYDLDNSLPDGMVLSRTRLQNSGESFTITFTGVCMEGMPITIEDDMGRLTTVTVTNREGETPD